MNKIYHHAISFSIGLLIGDAIFFIFYPQTSAFAASAKAIFVLALFCFVHLKLEKKQSNDLLIENNALKNELAKLKNDENLKKLIFLNHSRKKAPRRFREVRFKKIIDTGLFFDDINLQKKSKTFKMFSIVLETKFFHFTVNHYILFFVFLTGSDVKISILFSNCIISCFFISSENVCKKSLLKSKNHFSKTLL